MGRHRSRSPAEKEKKSKKHSKRRDDSSESPAKKDKESKPHVMETRSKYDILTLDSGRKNSMIEPETPAKGPGDFSNFKEITEGTKKSLLAKEITSLFPVQYMSFNNVYAGDDMVVRDLTGSGKTLAFSLPLIERLRSQKQFRTGEV
jgi:ATP-dependent RNA helicase DDX21